MLLTPTLFKKRCLCATLLFLKHCFYGGSLREPCICVSLFSPHYRVVLLREALYESKKKLSKRATKANLTRQCGVLNDWIKMALEESFQIVFNYMKPCTILQKHCHKHWQKCGCSILSKVLGVYQITFIHAGGILFTKHVKRFVGIVSRGLYLNRMYLGSK